MDFSEFLLNLRNGIHHFITRCDVGLVISDSDMVLLFELLERRVRLDDVEHRDVCSRLRENLGEGKA